MTTTTMATITTTTVTFPPDYVYLDDVQVLDYLIQEDFKRQQREEVNQTCVFYISELERNGELTFWYAFGFKNGSEYTDLFNGL